MLSPDREDGVDAAVAVIKLLSLAGFIAMSSRTCHRKLGTDQMCGKTRFVRARSGHRSSSMSISHARNTSCTFLLRPFHMLLDIPSPSVCSLLMPRPGPRPRRRLQRQPLILRLTIRPKTHQRSTLAIHLTLNKTPHPVQHPEKM